VVSGNTDMQAARTGSRTVAPVLDTAVVGFEAMFDAPQHGLGAALDADLAVNGANVGLDRVLAQVRQRRHLEVASALGDQRQDLGLPVGEPFDSAGPVEPHLRPSSAGGRADNYLTSVDRLEGLHQRVGRERLGEIATRSLADRAGDQIRMKVPRVDHRASGTGMVDQYGDFALVRFGLGERVVQSDVYPFLNRGVGIDLGDHNPGLVLIEHVSQADEDNVVVVDERDSDGTTRALGSHSESLFAPRGVVAVPKGWLSGLERGDRVLETVKR
jgi:hypothetical protein